MLLMKLLKPTTPSQRHRILLTKTHLFKGEPLSQLTHCISRSGGRNHSGHITVAHRGGGNKRRYRLIDYRRHLMDISGEVVRLEYDPNRSVSIALIKYTTGILRYILAPEALKAGDVVVSISKPVAQSLTPNMTTIELPTLQSDNLFAQGNSMPLSIIPEGMAFHNLELVPGHGGQLLRSAGCFGKLTGKTAKGYGLVTLPSGEIRQVHLDCRATIGRLSNALFKNTQRGKAGVSRWLSQRPTVRGVAMNPIDHPHGGGQGRPCVTPWGRLTKGQPTRCPRKVNRFIVTRKRTSRNN